MVEQRRDPLQLSTSGEGELQVGATVHARATAVRCRLSRCAARHGRAPRGGGCDTGLAWGCGAQLNRARRAGQFADVPTGSTAGRGTSSSGSGGDPSQVGRRRVVDGAVPRVRDSAAGRRRLGRRAWRIRHDRLAYRDETAPAEASQGNRQAVHRRGSPSTSVAATDPCAVVSTGDPGYRHGLGLLHLRGATGDMGLPILRRPQTNPTLWWTSRRAAPRALATFKRAVSDGQDVSGVGQDAWWDDSVGVLAVDLGNDEITPATSIDLQPDARTAVARRCRGEIRQGGTRGLLTDNAWQHMYPSRE